MILNAVRTCTPVMLGDGTYVGNLGHDKCYCCALLGSSPSRQMWVCRVCKMQGVDVVEHAQPAVYGEYERLVMGS